MNLSYCWNLLGKCLVPFKDCLIVDLLWLVLPIACYLLLVKIFREQIGKSRAATGKRLWQILTSNWQMMFFSFLLSLLALGVASAIVLEYSELCYTNDLEKRAPLDKNAHVTYSYVIRRYIYTFSQIGIGDNKFKHFYDIQDERQIKHHAFQKYNTKVDAPNSSNNNSSREIIVKNLIAKTIKKTDIKREHREKYKIYNLLYDVFYKYCNITHSAVWVLIWTIIACWWFIPDMSARPPRRR